MAESIFVRVQRVVSGGAESIVDKAEQLSGSSLMRQAIRDMEVAIRNAADELDAARARRIQADHHGAECRKQLATLAEQASFALSKGREDLTAAAIARQLDVEEQIGRFTRTRDEAAGEEARIGETLASLRSRAKQMQDDHAAFQSAQRAAAYDAEAPSSASTRAERKASAAEQAFERAMGAAGGVPNARPSADGAAKVAEIEALQRAAEIAERLAALRGGAAPEPAPKSQGRKPKRG